MSQNVWGYWDCPYCDTKKIRGDNKHCPNCAAPIEPGTKFYMDKQDKLHPDYVPEEQKSTAANRECLYCHAQNDAKLTYCPNCGTHKGESAPPPPPP